MKNIKDNGYNVRIAELKCCPIRFGRMYDGKIIMTCGKREVEASECIICTVHGNENC